MEITEKEMKQIVDTLPIGLYARRKVPCVFDTECNTSYYIPEKDEIHISYKGVSTALSSAIVKNEDREQSIRANIYHELSHAILTSNWLFTVYNWYYSKYSFDIINIFEDERIETIFKDFYYNVNFKRNILLLCGGQIPTEKNVMQGFFNLVRFRCCDDDSLVNRVEEIINRYNDINAITDNCDHINDYVKEIIELYDDFAKHFKQNGGNSSSNGQRNNISDNIKKNGTVGSGKGSTENVDGQGEKSKSTEKSSDSDSEENSSENGNNSDDNNTANSGDKSEDEENSNGGEKSRGCGRGNAEDIFKAVTNTLRDSNLTATLDTIISQFNKKNSKGASLYSYSGVINPRLTNREDYRYFERPTTANGNNRYGTFHLNLYIDNSGSFDRNRKSVNTLLNSLLDIEKKNKNFSFDLIRCGSTLRDTPKTERYIECNEGTYAEYDEVKSSMKNHNKSNTYNYNIVLYDGECEYHGKNCFRAWDTNNTTLIVERGNFKNVAKLKSANVVRIDDGSYTEKLTTEVVKALSKAFR